MSKNMLGPFLRALGQVPDRHLGLVLDILHKISGERGELVRERLSEALKTPEVVVPAQTNVHIEHVPAEYRQFFEALPAKDRAWILANPRTAIPLFVKAVSTARVESLPLVFLNEIKIPALDEFRVSEKFRSGETIDGVEILEIRGYSRELSVFMEQVDPPTPEANLRIHTTNSKGGAAKVLDSFGDHADITVGQLWEVLKRTRHEDLLKYYRNSNYFRVRTNHGQVFYIDVRHGFGIGWDIWVYPRSKLNSSPAGKNDRFITR